MLGEATKVCRKEQNSSPRKRDDREKGLGDNGAEGTGQGSGYVWGNDK